MDAQDFRSLQEAYMEVVENQQLDEAKEDEGLTPLQKIRKRNKAYAMPGEPAGQQTSTRRAERSSTRGVKKERGAPSTDDGHIAGKWSREAEVKKRYGVEYNQTGRREQNIRAIKSQKRVGGEKGLPEQADIYDIILSHLLDEGYAETPEAAEAIMVNMSEEWREGILDEMQYITPPQPSAIVRPAPSKINRTPSKINQKGREINQAGKGSGMAAQAALGLGAAGVVAASNRREKKKYKM